MNKKIYIVKRKKRNFKIYMEYILIRKSFVSHVVLRKPLTEGNSDFMREAEIFLGKEGYL